MRDIISKLDRDLHWARLPHLAEITLRHARAIQQIPAPTFHEHQRALHVRDQFQRLGLADILIDAQQNVYGRLPGSDPDQPGLMLAAHTDTVFPAKTDLTQREQDDLIYGPGLGDNSMGVAGLLGALEAFRQYPLRPGRDIWFVATSCEEGLGDLAGMRAAYQRLADQIDAVINLEGLAYGHVYHAGIRVRRLRITARTEGGHSWLHFGRDSATHILVNLGTRITALTPPQAPRTTFNIGRIEGGQGINVIATEASLWLDLRSEDHDTLSILERQVHDCIRAVASPQNSIEVEVVGDRPGGSIPVQHPLVQAALSALAQQGVAGSLETGSTDGNIPLAANCPTVTIGITRGGNAHRTDEYIETGPILAGMRQLILLTLATSGFEPL